MYSQNYGSTRSFLVLLIWVCKCWWGRHCLPLAIIYVHEVLYSVLWLNALKLETPGGEEKLISSVEAPDATMLDIMSVSFWRSSWKPKFKHRYYCECWSGVHLCLLRWVDNSVATLRQKTTTLSLKTLFNRFSTAITKMNTLDTSFATLA